VFRRVSVPILAPGVVAASLFAFAVSFDQFVISYFLAPPGVTTLPVEIYTSIRKGFTPEINAISTIIILVSMGLMLIVARFYRFGGERSGNE
jgi:spermidine/putrescine transport system permease protein